jgi:hypothetical protein
MRRKSLALRRMTAALAAIDSIMDTSCAARSLSARTDAAPKPNHTPRA